MTVVERTLEPESEAGRFEHFSPRADDAFGLVRRRFFDWLERRAFTARTREDLLAVLSAVAGELTSKRSIAFSVTAEDSGDGVLLRFDTRGIGGWSPVRLGRCLAALDRVAAESSVALFPVVGERHLLVDVAVAG
ncbi:MAG: hypothetical protein M3394_09955 [Actinomycetota bacterium]|nr:hypothetical protein [Actinomycetota bacterium]